jgi:hypothetical protein
MTNNELPALEDIQELTAYLPRLYAEDFSPIVKWEGGEKRKDGSYSMSYPKYGVLVEEFFRKVAGAWLDYEYNPEQAYKMLRDEDAVKAASLAQIKTMLTFYVRGERFSNGHWGEMIEKGYIRRVLERLDEIKSVLK